MNIEEIIQTYLEEKNKIETKYAKEKNLIKLRLERLINSKEQEIDDYVRTTIDKNPNFYAGYGAMVRKDLEQTYKKNEKNLEDKLNAIDNICLRELVEIKKKTMLKLSSIGENFDKYGKELNSKLHMMDTIMSSYGYQNNEERSAELYNANIEERANLLKDRNNFEQSLLKYKKYHNMLSLTEEEKNIVLEPMDDLQKELYNKINGLVDIESIKENTDEQSEVETNQESIETNNIALDDHDMEDVSSFSDDRGDIIDTEDFVFKPLIDNEKEVMVKNVEDLLKLVYSDIIELAEDMRSIKLDPSKGKLKDNQYYLSARNDENSEYKLNGTVDLNYKDEIILPNGIYLYGKDIIDALKKYYKKTKGRTYKIEGINNSFAISNSSVNQIKKILKDISILELLKDKKIGEFDIRRVYGKESAEQYSKRAEIGSIKTDLPEGDYFNRNEFIYSLKNLFIEKKPSWLDRFKQKTNDNFSEDIDIENNIENNKTFIKN